MANIHALTVDGGQLTLVYHLAVPAGSNAAGVAWSAALVASGLGGATMLPDGDGTGGTISAAEKASLAAGTLYEDTDTLNLDGATTPAQRAAYVDARYTAATTRVQSELQRRLRYFGMTR